MKVVVFAVGIGFAAAGFADEGDVCGGLHAGVEHECCGEGAAPGDDEESALLIDLFAVFDFSDEASCEISVAAAVVPDIDDELFGIAVFDFIDEGVGELSEPGSVGQIPNGIEFHVHRFVFGQVLHPVGECSVAAVEWFLGVGHVVFVLELLEEYLCVDGGERCGDGFAARRFESNGNVLIGLDDSFVLEECDVGEPVHSRIEYAVLVVA